MEEFRAPYNVLVIPFHTSILGFEYAVLRRSDAGYWQPVAGGGRVGEAVADAAKRETWEETGIPGTSGFYRLDSMDMIPKYHFAASKTWPAELYVLPQHCFGVESSTHDLVLSSEHTEFRWVNFDEANSLLHWQSNKTALWELHQRLTDGRLPIRL